MFDDFPTSSCAIGGRVVGTCGTHGLVVSEYGTNMGLIWDEYGTMHFYVGLWDESL
jgi:hypothetical protein